MLTWFPHRKFPAEWLSSKILLVQLASMWSSDHVAGPLTADASVVQRDGIYLRSYRRYINMPGRLPKPGMISRVG